MARKRCKRAQSASGAAGLIAVIGLLLVMYILLIPPEEREKLLEEEEEEENWDSVIEDNLTLLLAHPGRLDYQRFDEYDHDVSPVFLFSVEESQELKLVGSFYIKNGVFDRKFHSFEFKLADVDNTDKVMLSFVAEKHKGILTIRLNGRTIFEEDLQTTNPSPIAVPTEYLSSTNELEFFVSSVGWHFWTTNEYRITNFRIIGEVTDVSRQESKNLFIISDFEFRNLDTATLKFNPECTPGEVGILDVYINNHNIFSGVPDCGIVNKKYFSVAYLSQGENMVVFSTRRGRYLIDNIVVKTELKEFKYPVYSFELNESLYNDVRQNKVDIILKLEFFNDKELKQADVFVNGHRTAMSTYDKNWTRNIDNYVDFDYNSLKIVPDHSSFDVIELRVVAEGESVQK